MVKANPYNYILQTQLQYPVTTTRIGFTNSFTITTAGQYQYAIMPVENFTRNKTLTAPFGTVNLAIKDMLGRISYLRFALALEIDCSNFNGQLGQYLIDNQVFAVQHLQCLGSSFE